MAKRNLLKNKILESFNSNAPDVRKFLTLLGFKSPKWRGFNAQNAILYKAATLYLNHETRANWSIDTGTEQDKGTGTDKKDRGAAADEGKGEGEGEDNALGDAKDKGEENASAKGDGEGSNEGEGEA